MALVYWIPAYFPSIIVQLPSLINLCSCHSRGFYSPLKCNAITCLCAFEPLRLCVATGERILDGKNNGLVYSQRSSLSLRILHTGFITWGYQ